MDCTFSDNVMECLFSKKIFIVSSLHSNILMRCVELVSRFDLRLHILFWMIPHWHPKFLILGMVIPQLSGRRVGRSAYLSHVCDIKLTQGSYIKGLKLSPWLNSGLCKRTQHLRGITNVSISASSTTAAGVCFPASEGGQAEHPDIWKLLVLHSCHRYGIQHVSVSVHQRL